MNELCAALLNHISGEVRFDPVACALYSTDASIYEIKPLGVVMPKTVPISSRRCRFCAEHHVPLIPRAAAAPVKRGRRSGAAWKNAVIHLQPSDAKLRKNWRWPKL